MLQEGILQYVRPVLSYSVSIFEWSLKTGLLYTGPGHAIHVHVAVLSTALIKELYLRQ